VRPLPTPLRTARGTIAARPIYLAWDGDFAGEAAPLRGFGTESDVECFFALERWAAGGPAPDVRVAPTAAFAVETAREAAAAAARGLPLAAWLALGSGDVEVPTSVPVNALLFATVPGEAAEEAVAACALGYRTLKLKVGAATLDADVARVRAVRAAVGDHVALRLDANGAWDVEGAQRALSRLREFAPEYVEQPVPPSLDGEFQALAEATGTKLAADESASDPTRARALIAARAVDVLVLKPQRLGLGETVRIGREARAAGLRVVVSTLLDGPIGVAASLHAACAIHAGEASVPAQGLAGWEAASAGGGARGLGGAAGLGATAVAGPDEPPRGLLLAAAMRTPSAPWLRLGDRVVTRGELARMAGGEGERDEGRGGEGDPGASGGRDEGLGGEGDPGASGGRDEGLGGERDGNDMSGDRKARAIANAPAAPGSATDPVRLFAGMVAALAAERGIELETGAEAAHGVIVRTSGTTGPAQPLTLSEPALVRAALAVSVAVDYAGGDWLSSLPISTIGGLSVWVRALVADGCARLVLPFDPSAAAIALADPRTTHASFVARTLQRVLDVGGHGSASLRCVLVGGGATDRALIERARAAGVPAVRTWGMTETAAAICVQAPSDVGGDSGRPVGGWEVVARAEGGTTLPARAPGRLFVRGRALADDIAGPDGWFATGDLGSVADDGAVTVIGRADDVIVTGGVNVHPDSVEAVLCAHPSVAEAAVFGVADDVWGERIVAIVRAAPFDPDALAAWCRARLPPPQRPREFLRASAPLPRTPTGKLQRRLLRDAAALRRCPPVSGLDT
jgi:O-succinylbenzoic acid--CoA ligase